MQYVDVDSFRDKCVVILASILLGVEHDEIRLKFGDVIYSGVFGTADVQEVGSLTET
jgi:hypothetical protein